MFKGRVRKPLAEAVGISLPMMNQIERGSKIPNAILARDISRGIAVRSECSGG